MAHLAQPSFKNAVRLFARNQTITGLLKLHFRLLPDRVHGAILSKLGQHFLKGQALHECLHEMEGKRICLFINDFNCHLLFQIRDGQLKALSSERWDVKISGYLDDFYLLAFREQDPDTLFFQRRLKLEGDIEAGLWIKNLLDSVEYDWHAHFEVVFSPRVVNLFERFKSPNIDKQ